MKTDKTEQENILLKEIDPTWALTISSKLEHKISYLCLQLPSTEWSGVLYYSVNTENKTLVGEDVQLLDVGTAATTEFDLSPEVVSYMVENDLLDCQTGLIHSHHTMATFFSGTDTNTLKKQGSERNRFLSLIVNNKKEYSAALTTKLEGVVEKTIKGVYKDFNDSERPFETSSEGRSSLVLYEKIPISFQDQTFYKEMEDVLAECRKKNTTVKSPYSSFYEQGTFDWNDYFNSSPKTSSLNTFYSSNNQIPSKTPSSSTQFQPIFKAKDKTKTKTKTQTQTTSTQAKGDFLLNKSIDQQIETLLSTYDKETRDGALHITAEILTLSKLPLAPLTGTVTDYYDSFEEITSLGFADSAGASCFIEAFVDALMAVYVDTPYPEITYEILKILVERKHSTLLEHALESLSFYITTITE